MTCLPTARDDVEKVALPLESVLLAMLTPLSRNVTVPVAVPVAGERGLTVAVNVTDWPNTDGSTEELTAVELFALLTVWVIADDVLLAKLLSPL